MIVDFHTHTFPDKIAAATVDKLQSAAHIHPFTDGSVAGLSASMRAAGIGLSVSLPVATSPRQVPHIDDASVRICESTEETGVLAFGCMHPLFPDPEAELDRIVSMGLRGVKLHPPYQGVPFDDPRYVRILTAAGARGLIVVVHAGLDVGLPGVDLVSPDRIRRAVEAAGPVTLVCAHMGGWRQWDAVAELLPDTGVYLDTSFSLGRIRPNGDGHPWTEEALEMLTEEAFLDLVGRFGADRILFGTDCPWGGQAEAVERIRALSLSEADREAVLGGNALRLLGDAART